MPAPRLIRTGAAATAWSLAIIGTGIAALGMRWTVAGHGVSLPTDFEPGPGLATFLGTLPFVAAGGVVASRRPGNAIGWLLLGMGVSWQITSAAGAYRVVLHAAGGSTPAAAWLWDVFWIPAIIAAPVLFLLFPTGRLPTRRWRPVAALLAAATVLLLLSVGARPGPLTNTPVPNPLGMEWTGRAAPVMEQVGNVAFALATVAAFAAPWLRYRRAGRQERAQLRWFLGAAVLVLGGFALGDLLLVAGASGTTASAVRTAPLVALPIAVAVAVLRYRLYAIDRILTRTMTATGLLAVVGLVYAAVVAAIGAVVGGRQGASVPTAVIATAAAAVAFQPARQRLQKLVNRIVYGQRAGPYDVLSSFTHRMSVATPPDEAPTAIARAVAESLPVRSCTVWLVVQDELRLAGGWPETPRADPVPCPGGELRLPAADHAYSVRHDDVLIGAIGVTLDPGEQLLPSETRLLRDLAAAAWPVVDNAQLLSELRSSRQRLVTAQDAQRRRTERDLHDGAQQRLLELALTLQIARQEADQDNSAASGTIAAAELQLRAALAELRDLARGIHPTILTDRGLVAAIESLAQRAPVTISVLAPDIPRLSPALEATAYFVAAEAVANVIKHSGAEVVGIEVELTSTVLTLTVQDDGHGGADATRPGLRGLADRVGALDGQLRIVSPPGRGTRVQAVLPCA